MENILGVLGIDWKLFLSQALNFFILLVVLRAFVYKPLLAMIKKRNERIKEGLDKAREADIRLHEADGIAKEKLKQADLAAVGIIHQTQEKAKALADSLAKKAEKHQEEVMQQIALAAERQKEEARREVLKGAAELVKKFITKTVQLQPEAIDQALIQKAVSEMKNYED